MSRKLKSKGAKSVATALTEPNLPRLAFEESVRSKLNSLATQLPSGFTPENLVSLIHSFLEHSSRKISLPGHRGLQKEAIAIREDYLRPPFVGKNWELLDQRDFKEHVEPLLINENFLAISEDMQMLRQEAQRRNLEWAVAAGIIRKVAEELRPDQRPEGVRRGELCEQVITELRQIKQRHLEVQSFRDLEQVFPDFQVIRMLRLGSFDDDDRELLAHPRRWESVVVHAYGLLKRRFIVGSDETISKYRKQFKSHVKQGHRPPDRKPSSR
jgi:hypothetical protein